MIKHLSVFTSEVTRVRARVGHRRQAGGQVAVRAVTASGTDLTDISEFMASI